MNGTQFLYLRTGCGGVIGTTKTITDQAGKKRQGIADALGNMVRVIEDPNAISPAVALTTDYVFDTLGNLRKTIQGDQNRYFMYDSLGRVLFAKQPEQDTNPSLTATDPITNHTAWSVKYEYDDNGNILTTTDAKDTTITATYDRLNRIKTRDYEDSTPDVKFYYDGIYLNASDQVQTATGSVKGKTTGVKSSVSRTNYIDFDDMGRLEKSQQITDGQTYPFEYAYNLSGALIEETYPSGRKVQNTLNADGELSQVRSKKNANSGYWTYADSFAYDAAGAVTKMQLGNGLWETASYDDERLQVKQIGLGTTDSTQNLLKLEFKYNSTGQTDNNGSMREQKITVPAVGSNPTFTATQTYSYDSLNRIHDAEEKISSTTKWKQTFKYDRFGNRRFDTTNTGDTTTLGSCAASICNPDINTSDNRLSAAQGYDFDENGNLEEDAENQRFRHDAENHQKEFYYSTNTGSTPDATYHYDGDGRRVKKIVGSEVTVFVYNAKGQLAAEYSTTIEPATTAQVSYLTTDHLGSPRITTDKNGGVISRKDFTAFGEEVTSSERLGGTSGNGYNPPEVRQDYTGYQKDEESGLEFAQARYYNTRHGRFTSVDPLTASATIRNPQTFNRYSYVLNSPYKFTDPLGLMAGGHCNTGRCVSSDPSKYFWGEDGPYPATLKPSSEALRAAVQHEQVHSTKSGNQPQAAPPQTPPPVDQGSSEEGEGAGESSSDAAGAQTRVKINRKPDVIKTFSGVDAEAAKANVKIPCEAANDRGCTTTEYSLDGRAIPVKGGFTSKNILTLTIEVTLPQWAEYNKANADQKEIWDTFITKIREHEEGHVKISTYGAYVMGPTIPTFGRTAAGLEKGIKAAVEAGRAKVRQDQRFYHRFTPDVH